jgi:hypothetical protein
LNVTLPASGIFPRTCFGASTMGLVQEVIRNSPLAGGLLSLDDKFLSLRDKLRQSHFFAREGIETSGILKLSPRGNRHAPRSEKYRVMPIGYVLLEICLRGPQFRETIVANLAAFASACARCHRRSESSAS